MNPTEQQGTKPESMKLESAKSKRAKQAKPDSALDLKTPMLNPTWADEVVKALGIGGPIAKAVAAEISREIESDLIKVASPDKLKKLARAAVNKNLGKCDP